MTDKAKGPSDPAKPVGPEYQKGGDPAHMIFPENRPRDVTGSTPPTPADARAKAIEDRRIAEEQAHREQGGRSAGDDEDRGMER